MSARRHGWRRAASLSGLLIPQAMALGAAWLVKGTDHLAHAALLSLAPLWAATLVLSLARLLGGLLGRQADEASILDRVDVLTPSGSYLAWSASAVLVLATWIGWASLSIVGLFGLVAIEVAVVAALLRLGGARVWRTSSLSRRFLPEVATEGESVVDEITLRGARVPPGFRLLLAGAVGPRWPVSRFAVDAPDSLGELVLRANVGPAVRGDYEAEPLTVWIQDVLGLCQSRPWQLGKAHLTVTARPRVVSGAQPLLGRPGSNDELRTAVSLPTEGSLRLREYQPGDDARRIHWVRSLAAREIVVRLPDELPPPQPAVRLVLDTYLRDYAAVRELSCPAPAELLDTLVGVWLGIGNALATAGTKVTLVSAAPEGDRLVPARHALTERTRIAAARLAARLSWQKDVPLEGLLTDEATIVVSPHLPGEALEKQVKKWVVLSAGLWPTRLEPAFGDTTLQVPFPLGAEDNRWSRQRARRSRQTLERSDMAAFTVLFSQPNRPNVPNLVVAWPGRRGASDVTLEAFS